MAGVTRAAKNSERLQGSPNTQPESTRRDWLTRSETNQGLLTIRADESGHFYFAQNRTFSVARKILAQTRHAETEP
jgi:hypothetical protein